MALLRVGFTKPSRSPGMLVSSYLTVSPLPGGYQAVCSLWHFPASHPGSPLATTLPCGVRTFLGGEDITAAAALPTRPRYKFPRYEVSLTSRTEALPSG